MRTYAYFRTDSLSLKESDFHNYIVNNDYSIPKSRVVFEDVEIHIPFKFRSKILNLIKYTLESGDVLLVGGIDSLGSSFVEICSTIEQIFEKKIRLVCLELSKKEINDDYKTFFICFIKMCSNFESKYPKIKSKNYNIVKKVGRPEILNEIQKEEILVKFKRGQSIYSLAKQYSVSRTVIQRLLYKSSI